MTFSTLGLSEPLLRALSDKGYEKPTPIQTQAIPPIIEGRDVMAAAQTGTGKTASFTLPMLHRLSKGPGAKPNSIRALVLTPTRELAAQVHENVAQYAKHLPLQSAVVYGGVKINPQMMKLRRGVDVLVATPGRLMDLYNQNAVKFKQLEILVLDEADRMLDMGFINDIRKIIALLPKQRQNLMFSATFSGEIRSLTKGILNNPVEIDVSPRNTTATSVKQLVHPVDKKDKTRLLIKLMRVNDWEQVLVFCRTKRGANKLVNQLVERKIHAAVIHGDKSQAARTKALEDFKTGVVRALVATDVAARGIDITDLPHVINFDLPDVAENYVHRIGRTGRAGATGEAISLVSADEVENLSDIENLIGKLLDREFVDEFEPKHNVPQTHLSRKKVKTRPKKPKVKPQAPTGQVKKSATTPPRKKPNLSGKTPATAKRKPVKKPGAKPNPKSSAKKKRPVKPR
ncbi:MAG: DEAD/DEAH box helicase [Gammaproteobacteria bacterium]|nr:DEAD/DEAH box helicase [Gammaproteobacteria bacterium]